MRFFSLVLLTLFIGLTPALAQDRPLYNSRSTGTGTPLYNSGARPLSLKQITEGISADGYSYSRSGNSNYRPYGGAGSYPSEADVAAFRKRRAAEAQASEKMAMQSLQKVHTPPSSEQGAALSPAYPGQVTGTPGQSGTQTPVKVRQQYKGRDSGVSTPAPVFNSVR